ncbi:uncharacterized protein LOC119722042 [Patiria miniata]|uniref:CCHC-type domain-containing protein n=1 Tax=Patiria miniata TaxID=46514 RepID=A0A913Z835_PATMI|nr:uncharacterized protein LOC119722042 [Patiria miniata]
MEGMEQLRAELEAMKVALQAEKEEREKATAGVSSTTPPAKQIYVAAGRRLDRFRGKPEKPSDPSVQEWVSDVKGQLTARQIGGEDGAAFIIDHLAGRARQEILGRGDTVKSPEEIYRVLLKVFGDGETLPEIQQKFFSFRQGQGEDLLSFSLELMELFNSMARLDVSFNATRDKTLKGRLAEAVYDEGLRRELRRMNIDSPELSFFDARDRAIEWLGTSRVKTQKAVAVQEVKAEDGAHGMKALLERQGEQLQRQQQQIEALLQAMQRPARRWSQGPRRCYNCQSTGHLKRDCPHPPSSPLSGGTSQGTRDPQQFVPQQSMAQHFVPQQSTAQQFIPQQSSVQQFVPQQSPAQQFVPQKPGPQLN